MKFQTAYSHKRQDSDHINHITYSVWHLKDIIPLDNGLFTFNMSLNKNNYINENFYILYE